MKANVAETRTAHAMRMGIWAMAPRMQLGSKVNEQDPPGRIAGIDGRFDKAASAQREHLGPYQPGKYRYIEHADHEHHVGQ